MRVGPVEVSRDPDGITRQAQITWEGGSYDLMLTVPAEWADEGDDASSFLCAALPLALHSGEPLVVEGPVSPLLASRCDEIRDIYNIWNPTTHPVELTLRTGEPTTSREDSPEAAFFSRGVDSLFTATRDRRGPRRLESLVFVDGLEPVHDDGVRKEEIRLARVAADEIGLPLAVLRTNLRLLTDRFRIDWEDVVGAGLSFVAHGIATRFGTLTIPSTDSYHTLEACGTHPLLDPLFSTERMAIHHDGYWFSRLMKIRWMAQEAPEALAHIKVCNRENRSDNCGYCGKCLYTMITLEVAGRLRTAQYFGTDLDLTAIAGIRSPHMKSRIDLAEVAAALEGTADRTALRAALLEAVHESSLWRRGREDETGRWTVPSTVRQHHLNLLLSLALEGVPYPPPGERTSPPPRCLVQLGATPAARVAVIGGTQDGTALGKISTLPMPGAIPFWINGQGCLLTRGMVPPRSTWFDVLRWVIDPMADATLPVRRRLRATAGRLRRRLQPRPPWDEASVEGTPAGFLYGVPADGRVPLYAAWHRSGAGQELAVEANDPRMSPCYPPMLLGYLDEIPEPSDSTSQ
jgi:hypothetical protein